MLAIDGDKKCMRDVDATLAADREFGYGYNWRSENQGTVGSSVGLLLAMPIIVSLYGAGWRLGGYFGILRRVGAKGKLSGKRIEKGLGAHH